MLSGAASTIIVSEEFKPFWQVDLPDDDYHGEKGFVSSTGLKKIIMKSPKTFYSHVYLGKFKEPTPAMKFGKLAHMAILEGSKFKERYVVRPEFWGFTQKGEKTTNPNCKEVKEKAAAWEMTQKPDAVIVTEEQRDHLFGMIESLLSHEKAMSFLSEGDAEISGFYRDKETGIGCKIRPDFMSLKRGVIADLKTCEDARAEAFQWQIFGEKWPLWYDFSLAMYADGYHQITGRPLNLAGWIAVEKEPPYEVAVHPMTIPVQEVGHIKYRRALRLLKECIDTGRWPGIQESDDMSAICPPDNILTAYGVNYEGDLL